MNGDKEIFSWSADHVNRIGNLPVDLYSAIIWYDNNKNNNNCCSVYPQLPPVIGHLRVITVGGFFSPSTMVRWVCNSRDQVLCARVLLLHNESFNDWGGRGYDDSVPGEVTKTATSKDRTARSSIWSASLP